MAAAARISVNIHELVSKNITVVSKKGKNTSQTGKQFGKYFYCFCLAEALLAEAEVEKTPHNTNEATNYHRTCKDRVWAFCRGPHHGHKTETKNSQVAYGDGQIA